MPQRHTEETFEEAIEQELLISGGYAKGYPDHFDREIALDKTAFITFLKQSQPEKWDKLQTTHGTNIETNVIKRLLKVIDLNGCLDVIRNGFTDYGVKFQMAFFKPESSLNPDSQKLYDSNILTVTRQVKYTTRNENTLDIVLGLNGLPVATVELKNQMTGQNVENAKKQYKYDRHPKDLIFQFNKRSLVHFTVDTNEAWMTTKLEGNKTYFLPFNKGNNNGKGNPPNPDGYCTDYLWKYVWAKNSWLDIIGKFLHLEVEEVEINGKKKRKQQMIFPRFHQLEVVRKLSEHAKQHGAGNNYLIQHSAGSGKSNSIAWLSYRLSSLHNKLDERVFDSVIVITDRKVLDNQLQDTIHQFEHKEGVVKKIDKNSAQLAEAIFKGSNIVITTLQKFPFVIDKIAEMEKMEGLRSKRNYAVIVDEAHSSQGGEASRKLKEVLSGKNLEEAMKEEADNPEIDDIEDNIRKTMMLRGKQKNLSFFAFTATPKAKTLEVFGIIKDGKPAPFHLYSMRQAIEEGFILDVLKRYTSYKTFIKLTKSIEDDPKIDKKKAKRSIARFISLHPHNLSQKTEVMVEHFRRIASKKIGGRAKAMVVTSSRLHAVRYKREFDKYIKENNYDNIKTLVAFSGIVNDEGEEFKETQMNKFGEKELPQKFNTNEYQILLVANKYQTGFDQPLLHTMYVDKKLSGVRAVQTLSRLNRKCKGKEDTFVLDFANETEDIQTSFQPYYELTELEKTTDPNFLYDLKTRIEQTQVVWKSEVNNFASVYFNPKFNAKNQAKLNAYIDPAVERYKILPNESIVEGEMNQDDFKHTLISFTRLYSFLSQIMPFYDSELEKFYPYIRFLNKKLPKKNIEEQLRLDDDIALEYYRLQKVDDNTNINLEKNNSGELSPVSEAGMRRKKDEEKSPLSEIIETLNERFGTEFDEADRLFFEQIVEDCVADEQLKIHANANNLENFKYPFLNTFDEKIIDRMEQNQNIFNKVMKEGEFSNLVKQAVMKEVYQKLNIDDNVIYRSLTI